MIADRVRERHAEATSWTRNCITCIGTGEQWSHRPSDGRRLVLSMHEHPSERTILDQIANGLVSLG